MKLRLLFTLLALLISSIGYAQTETDSEGPINGKVKYDSFVSSYGLNLDALGDEILGMEVIRYSKKANIDISNGDIYWAGGINFSFSSTQIGSTTIDALGYSVLAGAEYRFAATEKIIPYVGLYAGPSIASVITKDTNTGDEISTVSDTDAGGIFRFGANFMLNDKENRDLGINAFYDVNLEGGSGALMLGITFGIKNPNPLNDIGKALFPYFPIN